jgi:ParB family chromosome partitioning protein
MPRDVTNLWTFVVELDQDSRMALLAHCVALTVNAVKLPWDRKPRALATADRLAEAVSLDMTGYWRPTARSYFGWITKARILEAVREGVSVEAADRVADMKKPDMAEAAEQLLAVTDWLSAPMRTPNAMQESESRADGCCDGSAGKCLRRRCRVIGIAGTVKGGPGYYLQRSKIRPRAI